MMADTNIADGIAVKLLLAGLVLASAAVGAAGLAHVAPQADADAVADGLDADAPRLMFPINNISTGTADGAARLMFPINNISTGTADGAARLAFPIDNVTFSGGPWDVTDTDPGRWIDATTFRTQDMEPYVFPRDARPGFRSQDMDPYVFPQDMDPY